MKTKGICTLFVLTSLLSFAQQPPAGGVETAGIPLADGKKVEVSIDSLKQDPLLATGTLDNGLTWYIRPNAEPKGRMSVRLRVATGSLNEVEENQGIAHFIEHLVFNGTRHFKRGEMMPVMQRHGLGLGGDTNAYTSFDETVYMIDMPNLDDKTVDLSMTIMRDFGDGALLEESAIDAERGIIESELKVRDSAQYRVSRQMFSFLLNGTKIPDRFPIGTLDFIRNGKRDLFLDYYKTHYVPSQMQLVLVGDITVEQGRAWVDKYFADMPATPYDFKKEWGKLKVPTAPAAKWIYENELSMTSAGLVVVRPYEKKKDTAAQRIEDLPLEAAMGMLNTRFSRMVEKADCPFIGAGMSRQEVFESADMLSVNVAVSGDKWKESIASIEQETRRAAEFGFSDAELEEFSKNMIQAMEVGVKTWPTAKSDNIARGILASASEGDIFTDPVEDLRVLKVGLETLKANPGLCREALAKAWDTKALQVVVTSNIDNPDGAAQALACYKESTGVKVEAPRQEQLKPFAYDKVGEPGKVASTREVKDLDVTQLVLANGVRVNLKTTEFDKNSIRIRFAVDGGAVTRPLDGIGLDNFASAVMNEGGLEAHSQEELSRLMAGHSVGVGFSIDTERFIFSGGTTAEDFELELKLMIANMMHPGYRPEAEMKYRRSLPLIYNSMRHDPSGALTMEGMPFLFKGDKRFIYPTEEQAGQWTTADVKAWLDRHIKTGYLEVSIVGDFDREQIIPVLERTLAALPARPDAPAKIDPKAATLADSGSSATFDYTSKIDRTLACIVWKTGDGIDWKRARKVNLLQAVLRERLFKGIREKMGEAYSPYINSSMSRTYPGLGYMMAICPGVLANTETVVKAVDEIVGEMAGGIDEDELDRARKPMLNAFQRSLRSNSYWMGVIGDSQADPDQIEMARTRIDALKAMTLEEINELSREIFSPDNKVNINILPDADTVEKEEPAAPAAEEKKAA